MNILLITVPLYGAYMMIMTGGLMLLTNLIYYVNIPSEPLVIRFEDVMVTFSFGWCFWLVLIAGKSFYLFFFSFTFSFVQIKK